MTVKGTDRWQLFLASILVIIHVQSGSYSFTKPIIKPGREFDESNICMKFGRNQVINDKVSVHIRERTDGQTDKGTDKPKTIKLSQCLLAEP